MAFSEISTAPGAIPSNFAIIFVLGPPGAGKGTICSHLAQQHNLVHYSVGDSLRTWMRANRDTPLAIQIQDKLDNQGFLSSEDLNPFLFQAIHNASIGNQDQASEISTGRPNGIMIDGYPRCLEQLESFDASPFEETQVPDKSGNNTARSTEPKDGETRSRPDFVLCFRVNKQNAKERYLARGRDRNDSEEKFEKRFAEYEAETREVEDVYRHRGLLIEVDANGSKEENIQRLTEKLGNSKKWQELVG